MTTNQAARRVDPLGAGVLLPLMWTVLCVVVPLVFAPEVERGLDDGLVALAALAVLYPGTHLAAIIARGRPDWLPLMFWSFTYVWIGLALLTQALSGVNPYGVWFSPETRTAAIVMALVGMVAFDAGAFIARRRQVAPARPSTLDRRRVGALLAAALIVVPLLIAATSGSESLFTTRYTRALMLAEQGSPTPVSGIVSAIVMMLPLVAAASGIHLLRLRPDLRRRPAWTVSTTATVLLALVVANPVANPRYVAGTVILGLAFSVGLAQRPGAFRLAAVAVLAALVVVFPYADLFRSASGEASRLPVTQLMTLKSDYDTGPQMMGVIEHRAATGGTGGRQAIGSLGFFVPRAYWSEKPGATGALVTEYLGVPYTNVSSPVWVEAYTDFGLAGVVLALGMAGFVMTRASRTYTAGAAVSARVAVLTPLIAAYSMLVLRGAMLTAIGPLVVLVALGWSVGRRAGTRASAVPQQDLAGTSTLTPGVARTTSGPS